MEIGPDAGVRAPPGRAAAAGLAALRAGARAGRDAPGEVEGVAGFAAGLGNVERVDVLPFHQMGRFKWQELGLEYRLGDVAPPSAEAVGGRARHSARRG